MRCDAVNRWTFFLRNNVVSCGFEAQCVNVLVIDTPGHVSLTKKAVEEEYFIRSYGCDLHNA